MKLIVVYLWKESENLPEGHSSMKIEDDGSSEFYSWWPSLNGRATPPSYGPNSRNPRQPNPNAPNIQRQINDLKQREQNNKPGEQRIFDVVSDKVMLQSGDTPKHATFKFFFRDGLDVKAAKKYWEELLASETEYSSGQFNCHMPVATALIRSFADHVALQNKRVSDKDAKKLIKVKNDLLIPETSNAKAWSVAKIAKLCAYVAKKIDDNSLTSDSKVIIRANQFEKDKKVSKLDYGPKDADFTTEGSTGKMKFIGGTPGSANPRMSSLHHADEGKSDAEHFVSTSLPTHQ